MTAPVCKRRRDWFLVLRILMRHGVTMADVGRECGRRRETVQAWAEGGEPKETDARIVLALLAKHAPAAYAADQAKYGIRVTVQALADSSRPVPVGAGG
jgi:hypothetical protein